MQSHHSGAHVRWWSRRHAWLMGIAMLGLVLAACGKTSSSSSTTAASATTSSSSSPSTAASASCGTIPSLPINDSSGLIKSLGSTYTTAYNGNLDPIFPSAYAHFKPKATSNLTIGIAFTQPINPFQIETLNLLKQQLGAIKGVSHVTVLTSSPTGVTTQIQQVNQLIQQHTSVIVTEPLVPPAMAPLAAKAEAAGIPLVAVVNGIPSPNAVSVAVNSVADGLNMATGVAKLIASTGTVIGVHGIPTTGNDKAAFTGFRAVFSKCPNIKFEDPIVGEFQVPIAKQGTLTYLSSHPQPVAGAVETAVMGTGIVQAFQQAGRPQPALGNIEPSAGDLAYWNAHKSTYKSVAGAIGPSDVARTAAYTVSHLLSGHGPKVSEIVQPSALITNSNLSQWVVPGAGPTSQAVVSGPPGSWMPDSYMAPLFNG